MRKLLILTGVILTLLVGTSIQSFAEEICVCVNKWGRMRFSDSGQCSRGESLRCWNAIDPATIEDLQNQIDAFSLDRFTDMGDGTVRDNVARLIWLKDAGCLACSTMNWYDAMNAVALLAHGQCGLTDGSVAGDWRLPTKEEWEDLIDPDYTYPALCNGTGSRQASEGDPFNNMVLHNHWSSTDGNPGYAWHAPTSAGGLGQTLKDLHNYVLPVRDE